MYKPIIYLYPTEEMNITVELNLKGDFIYTYPEYPETGWKVTAFPNGDLIEHEKGRKLYSLFWEGDMVNVLPDNTQGFVVESSNLETFFEEKLRLLGLNYKEA